MFHLLEELIQLEVPTKDHWIFPGAVAHGSVISVVGVERRLVFTEIALAAATYTSLLGSLRPTIVPNVILVPSDIYASTVILQKLIDGRGIKKLPDTISIMRGNVNNNWDALETETKKTKSLLVVEQTLTNRVAVRAHSLAKIGITTVANELSGADYTIKIEKDLKGAIQLSIGNIVARAAVRELKNSVIFDPLPVTHVTKIEADVWKVIVRLKSASEEMIRKQSHYEASLVRWAVQALEEKDLIYSEQITQPISRKTLKVWAIKGKE